jgi:NAD+ kinase
MENVCEIPSLENIKNIIIVYRIESPAAEKKARQLGSWLKRRSCKVFSHPDQKISATIKPANPAVLKTVQLVVVLGGDGTYLEAVRMLGGRQVPILGINMGSLGFLTAHRKEEMLQVVSKALKNELEMRPRGMIEIRVKRAGKIIGSYAALNDAVIERGQFSQLINLGIYSEKHLINEIKADGVVVATPTGSTAYNLSAGGPILHPHSKTYVVTPICPHSLTHRPIIFPDDLSLIFRLINKKQKALLTVDGQYRGQLALGDEVLIRRASCDHYILRRPNMDYFVTLREKLKFGQR